MVEQDFENDIIQAVLAQGYVARKSSDYDPKTAVDRDLLFQFLQESQKEKLEKLQLEVSNPRETIIDSIYNEINSTSLLDVLRKGISIRNVHINLSYRKPYSRKNKNSYDLYQKNIFSVIRQLSFKRVTGESVDLGLFLNGFLVATVEIKDQFSKQTVEHATNQYKNRDTTERIFQFKRGAIIHFAVDYFDVFMSTKLEGQDTSFIPFNRDSSYDDKSYGTSYLWREIWEKDTWLDILLNFVQYEKVISKKDPSIVTENIIFPRYHQWLVVRKLLSDTKKSGPGQKYLIEHSTGSGKSKTIAWLAYELFSAHDNEDKNIFDSVIVISDRNVIVRQLKDAIKQLDETSGIVQNPATSSELGNELEKTNRILISTQQKFHEVSQRITKLAGKHFAIIVDEAQSSQGGESSKKVAQALTDLDEFGDKIMKFNSKNLSYYAFSGTPKEKTLRIFGTKGSDGKFRPFDVYTMKQAIKEGFVLDVLKNYTTYKRYFQIMQKGQDKQVDAKKAIRTIMKLVNEDPKNISKKSQFIMTHFLENIIHKIGGKSKAMLVTDSRKQAVIFKKTLDEFVSRENLNFKVLAAFSGTVHLEGKSYTEENLNNPLHKKNFDLVNWFSTSEYRILVVADKYRVGFDQPLLHTMYVDKKLDGVNAVQTLSRLNRKTKGKDDVCIVDFVNTPEEIKESFSPYYQGILLSDNLDPQLLPRLYDQILEFRIVTEDDLDEFWSILLPEAKRKPSNEDLVSCVSDARSRYKMIEEPEQVKFKKLLVNYVENYVYLTQILDYDDTRLEKLYIFGRRLLPTLPDTNRIIPLTLKDDIAVKYIELKKTFEGTIKPTDEDVELVSEISSNVTRSADVVAVLSDLILRINQEYSGRPITESETVCVEKLVNSILYDDEIISHFREKGNTVKNILQFSSFKDEFNEKLSKVLRYNDELYVDIKNNQNWQKKIMETVADSIALRITQQTELELPAISDDISQNKESYRRALTSCGGFLWFEDRYLNTDLLELFGDVIKDLKVESVRIITSLIYNKGIDDRFLDKIEEFQKILQERNIIFEVKVVSTRRLHKKMHDRYVLGNNISWSLPPISSVLDGSRSSFKDYHVGTKNYVQNSNDFIDWWEDADALEIKSNWNKIKELVSKKFYTLHCSICGKEFTLDYIPNPTYCYKHYVQFKNNKV